MTFLISDPDNVDVESSLDTLLNYLPDEGIVKIDRVDAQPIPTFLVEYDEKEGTVDFIATIEAGKFSVATEEEFAP